MPTYYYGADSADFSTNVMPTLIKEWGVPPSFYFRYLGNYQDTANEDVYLKGLGVRLGLVYNIGGADGGDGAWQANDAVARMRALGVHTLIFKDIETSMPVSQQFLLDWSNALKAAGVYGGFYANTEWQTFDSPYGAIVGSVDRLHRLVWSSEPEPGYYPPSNPPAWNPYPAAAADPHAVVGWQFTENQLGNIVDLNLFTEEAYNLLESWGVAPKPQPKPVDKHWRVGSPCDLKTAPNHGSSVAIDAKHRPVHLELGAYVAPTGHEVATAGEHWKEVRIPLSPVHGYVLISAIKQDP